MRLEQKTYTLPGGITLTGASRSTVATCWYVPELDVMFDMGMRLDKGPKPQHIFLTHTHTDHFGDILYYRRWSDPPHLYFPQEYTENLVGFLRLSAQLTESKSWQSSHLNKESFQLTPLCVGHNVEKRFRGRKCRVETVECHHSAPCLGYMFYEVRSCLKEMYRNLTTQEIGALASKGVPVSESTERPLFAYLGDTTEQVLVDNPQILQFPAVVMECTFLHADHTDRADVTGHACWEYLEPYVLNNPETVFYLSHFSLRYSPSEVKDFFAEKNLPNVVVMI